MDILHFTSLLLFHHTLAPPMLAFLMRINKLEYPTPKKRCFHVMGKSDDEKEIKSDGDKQAD